MTDEELKAEFIARRGVTICPTVDQRTDKRDEERKEYIARMAGHKTPCNRRARHSKCPTKIRDFQENDLNRKLDNGEAI